MFTPEASCFDADDMARLRGLLSICADDVANAVRSAFAKSMMSCEEKTWRLALPSCCGRGSCDPRRWSGCVVRRALEVRESRSTGKSGVARQVHV